MSTDYGVLEMDSEVRVRMFVWGNGSQKRGEHSAITKSGSPGR